MRVIRRPRYCRAIIICHGKSELILFSKLKSVLRLPIVVEGNDKGKSSIKIQSVQGYFEREEFKNKKDFCQKYFQEKYKDLKRKNQFDQLVKHLKIFIVLDADDATKDQIKRYKGCEYFKCRWLKSCCVPIINDPDLERVISNIGMEIPKRKRDKATFYRKSWSKLLNCEDDVTKFSQQLHNCHCTNMEKVLDYLLKI